MYFVHYIMMKQYFTILNFLLVGVVIFFGVKLFYKAATVPLNQIHIPEITQKQENSPTNKTHYPLSHYKNITERNLFNTKTETEKIEPVPFVKEPPQPTRLDLKLWGTVTGTGDNDYAVIQDVKKRKQNLYATGDIIQNAIIKEIFREKIVLNVDGKDEILKMEEFLTENRRVIRNPRIASPHNNPINITLNRSQIRTAVSNLNNLMRQAKIRPHLKNGKPDGLTLSRISNKSLFIQLGLKSGDIIKKVDGKKIQSVNDALKFYESLKSSSEVNLEIRRKGMTQMINYKIR